MKKTIDWCRAAYAHGDEPRTLLLDLDHPTEITMATVVVAPSATAAEREALAVAAAKTIDAMGGAVVGLLDDLAQLAAMESRRGAEA